MNVVDVVGIREVDSVTLSFTDTSEGGLEVRNSSIAGFCKIYWSILNLISSINTCTELE